MAHQASTPPDTDVGLRLQPEALEPPVWPPRQDVRRPSRRPPPAGEPPLLAASLEANPCLGLLGGFEASIGLARLHLQPAAQRLLAYVALQQQPVARCLAAGTLWPETSEERAAANLRSTLWRLGQQGHRLLDSVGETLKVASGVEVDVWQTLAMARALERGNYPTDTGTLTPYLSRELLPGWYEEWAIIQRERIRLVQLHAQEHLAVLLMRRGAIGQALEVCLEVVTAEPYRESTHRLIVEAHVADGNLAEALHHYQRFRELLWRDLRLRPSSQMEAVIARGVHHGGVGGVTPR
jgi:DNA-binding SARP family transcriptional activator